VVKTLFVALMMFAVIAAPGAAGRARAQMQYYPSGQQPAWHLVHRAQITLEDRRTRLARAEELRSDDFLSEAEVEQARVDFSAAEADYQNYLLQALSERSYLVIDNAVKKRDEQGGITVSLQLEYVTMGIPEQVAPTGVLAELLEAPLDKVFVSLVVDNVNVGDPYEARLENLRAGERRALRIHLLRDTDQVSVILRYANRVEQRTIILSRDASEAALAVNCRQISQEVDLGQTAEYLLDLERFSTIDKAVTLGVQGLPEEIGRTFVDSETGARLTEATFSGGETTRHLILRVFMPDRLSSAVPLDEPISFRFVANRAGGNARMAGEKPLVVTPRGVPKLEIAAPNLFLQMSRGSPAGSDMDVKNTGTKALDNIRFDLQAPMGWEGEADPPVIGHLDPGGSQLVRVKLTAPARTPGGEYEAKVQVSTLSNSRVVETEAKTVRIRLEAGSPVLGTILLGVLLLGLVGLVISIGVRISRR
jgi:hypothetical protein